MILMLEYLARSAKCLAPSASRILDALELALLEAHTYRATLIHTSGNPDADDGLSGDTDPRPARH